MSKKSKTERSHEHYEKMLGFVEEIIIDAIAASDMAWQNGSSRQRAMLQMYGAIYTGHWGELPYECDSSVQDLAWVFCEMLRYACELDDASNAVQPQTQSEDEVTE